MKTYSEYRAQARETLDGHWHQLAGIQFVLFLIGSFFSAPVVIGTYIELPWWIITAGGGGFNYLVDFLLSIPLGYAFYNVCLALVRKEKIENRFQRLFKEFSMNYGKYVLNGLLVFLICVALAVPTLLICTVILSLAYAMVPFVIRDNKYIGITEALKLSRKMMYGHKWELLCLELSFLGWILLSVLTLFIGMLWVFPYMTTTIAHFYEDVKAEYEAAQAQA